MKRNFQFAQGKLHITPAFQAPKKSSVSREKIEYNNDPNFSNIIGKITMKRDFSRPLMTLTPKNNF